jgi:hypothetical protein
MLCGQNLQEIVSGYLTIIHSCIMFSFIRSEGVGAIGGMD